MILCMGFGEFLGRMIFIEFWSWDLGLGLGLVGKSGFSFLVGIEKFYTYIILISQILFSQFLCIFINCIFIEAVMH